MKLKKRIYLLTPLLVLVCVIAAGVFMKAPAKVEAESYLIEKGTYEAVKLIDVIDNEKSDKYDEELGAQFDLVEFDTVLFDYDGDEWNHFWNIIAGGGNYFSFSSKQTDESIDNSDYTNSNYTKGVNSQGTPIKQGILDNALSDGFPGFSAISSPYHNHDWGKRMGNIMFNPMTKFEYNSNNPGIMDGLKNRYGFDDPKTNINAAIAEIREGIYPSKFQFVYNNDNGYYTYNSSMNHAQYNDVTKRVELYADTLGMTNGTKEQMSLIKAENIKKGTDGGNTGVDKVDELHQGESGDYGVDYDEDSGYWTIGSQNNGVTSFMLRTGENGTTFRPTLRIKNFNIPTDELFGTLKPLEEGTDIDSTKLEYIYIKFKISSSVPNTTFSNKLQVILTQNEGWMGSAINQNIYETEFTIGNPNGKCIKYVYEYDASQNDKVIELKIPIGNLTFNIGMISICPLVSTEPNFNSIYHKQDSEGWGAPAYSNGSLTTDADGYLDADCIYFDLYEFGLGYNINGKTSKTKSDTYGLSSFLPFHDIQDSYEGELEGRMESLDTFLSNWAGKVETDVGNKQANRACVNRYYDGGLDAVGTNSFGGTAPHFGMSMDIDFLIPEDGLTDFRNDIVFEFNGDDDLWVFVDDELVLDMGGKHLARNGIINFTTGTVIYDTAPVNGVTNDSPTGTINLVGGSYYSQHPNDPVTQLGDAYFKSNNFPKGNTRNHFYQSLTTQYAQDGVTQLSTIFERNTVHNIKVYYLERASGMSNCFIQFNLPQVPTADVIVSNEIKVSEDLDVKNIIEDLNGDGILDEKVFISNTDGKLSYNYTDAEGNVESIPNGLVTFDYIVEYLVSKEFDIDGDVLPIYTGMYNLYKTNDPVGVYVENLNLETIKKETVQKTVDATGDGSTVNKEYTKYIVRFSVPVGYYAKIVIPESSIVNYVNQENPKYSDVGLSPSYRYDDTDFGVNAKYYSVDAEGNIVSKEVNSKYESQLDNVVSGSSIGGYKPTDFLVGDNPNEAASLKTDFTNYIAMDLYDIEIEKKFKKDDPVPVGQSILYTVECGENHAAGKNCDNPFCVEPLHISMVIKEVVDNQPNPNIIKVTNLPKGNYKVTEKADWSWRYECYNVDVHRSDTGSTETGTVISAIKK